MKSIEQVGMDGAGTVTAQCVRVGLTPTFELVVHPAVLRMLPWWRGGQSVAVILAGAELTVMRGGPLRLLAVVTNRLDKLPPVLLRVPALEGMRPEPTPAPEAMPFEVVGLGLKVTLPNWARRPDRPRLPVTVIDPLAVGGVR